MLYTDHDDATLAQLVQEGDENAFEEIIDKTSRRVRRAIRNLIFDEEAIEDVAQETYIKLYKKIKDNGYDPEIGLLTTWLWTIAKNKAIDYLRSNKTRMRRKSSLLFEPRERINVRTLEDREEKKSNLYRQVVKAMRQVVFGMDKKYQDTFQLYFVQELGSKEVEEIIGVDAGTVRWRAHRVKKHIQKELTRLGVVEPIIDKDNPKAKPIGYKLTESFIDRHYE